MSQVIQSLGKSLKYKAIEKFKAEDLYDLNYILRRYLLQLLK